jgi:hypothetical protein
MPSVPWKHIVRMDQILSIMKSLRISLAYFLMLLRWNVNCIEERTVFFRTVELKKFLETFRSIFGHFYSSHLLSAIGNIGTASVV